MSKSKKVVKASKKPVAPVKKASPAPVAKKVAAVVKKPVVVSKPAVKAPVKPTPSLANRIAAGAAQAKALAKAAIPDVKVAKAQAKPTKGLVPPNKKIVATKPVIVKKPVVAEGKSRLPSSKEIAGFFVKNQEQQKAGVVKLPADAVIDGVTLRKGEKVMMIPVRETGLNVSRTSKANEESISATSQEKSRFQMPNHATVGNAAAGGEKLSLSSVTEALQRMNSGQGTSNFPVFKTRS